MKNIPGGEEVIAPNLEMGVIVLTKKARLSPEPHPQQNSVISEQHQVSSCHGDGVSKRLLCQILVELRSDTNKT